jgi:hypothetical protein
MIYKKKHNDTLREFHRSIFEFVLQVNQVGKITDKGTLSSNTIKQRETECVRTHTLMYIK